MPDMDLHPIAVATLAAIAASGQKPYRLSTPQEARDDVAARIRSLPPRPHPGIARIEDSTLAGPAGAIPVRRYHPATVSGPGAIVYAHGGGWVVGAPDLFDPLCSWLAAAAERPLISVGYRKAPEAPFPAPLNDMLAAIRAIAEDGPIVVAGDSAGGNLAAAAALTLGTGEGSPLKGQILLYPVLDHDFDTASYRAMGEPGRIISTADMRWFWEQYAPSLADRDDPRASPLRAPDLSRAPPAYIAVAAWDPLHDEGVRYAQRLRQSGVAATLDDLGDMMHGFCSQAGMLDRANEVLDRAGRLARAWLAEEVLQTGVE